MEERLPLITNPRSERMRAVGSLGRRSFRVRHGLLRVEGPQAVAELLRHRGEFVTGLYATADSAERHLDEWHTFHGDRFLVSDEVAKTVVPDAQGIFAVARVEAVNPGPSVWAPDRPIVVLPGTQDPGNAGVIVRSADAFGAAGVIACTGTVDLASPKVIRMSAGSVFHLPIVVGADYQETISALRSQGRTVFGAAGGSLSAEAEPSDLAVPHSWVFGNEAKGLSAQEEAACDRLLRVPMSGQAESLNVGVAAGICLFLSQQAGRDFRQRTSEGKR